MTVILAPAQACSGGLEPTREVPTAPTLQGFSRSDSRSGFDAHKTRNTVLEVLITQRSQVQILPPLQRKSMSQGLQGIALEALTRWDARLTLDLGDATVTCVTALGLRRAPALGVASWKGRRSGGGRVTAQGKLGPDAVPTCS